MKLIIFYITLTFLATSTFANEKSINGAVSEKYGNLLAACVSTDLRIATIYSEEETIWNRGVSFVRGTLIISKIAIRAEDIATREISDIEIGYLNGDDNYGFKSYVLKLPRPETEGNPFFATIGESADERRFLTLYGNFECSQFFFKKDYVNN